MKEVALVLIYKCWCSWEQAKVLKLGRNSVQGTKMPQQKLKLSLAFCLWVWWQSCNNCWKESKTDIISEFLIITVRNRMVRFEYQWMFETQESTDKTSKGEIGLIKTHVNPNMEQDKVFLVACVFCLHPTPIANVLCIWEPFARGHKAKFGDKVQFCYKLA